MKHIFFKVISLCLIISACSDPKEEVHSSGSSSQLSFSQDYQKPAFVNDQRAEKIKSIQEEIRALMETYAEENHIPGIAYGIVVDDQLMVSDAVGYMNLEKQVPAKPTTDFRIASMTKSFTAVAIMKLREEGKLALNDPVSDYIPEMANITYLTKDAPVIDIENLLTMTAGFPEDNPWGDRQLDESNQMLLDMISEGITFSNVPSFQYEYSNTGFAMLGYIVSQVSGKPYQEYIQEEILKPLGMNQTYWEIDEVPAEQLAIGYRWEDEEWKLEPMLHDGSFGAMGGLITTIKDFSKYVSFHLSAWPPRNGKETGPLKRSSLREMQTPQFPRLNNNAKNYKEEPCPIVSGYGFGLGIYQNCEGQKWVSHGGALPGFGSNYVFYPEYGIGIMAFCNLTYTTPCPLQKIQQLLFDKLDLQTRELPVSNILATRKKQLEESFLKGENALQEKIFAENFFLDESRDHRIKEINLALNEIGEINSVSEMSPQNQLRGTFRIQGELKDIMIFFTLSPTKNAEIQQMLFAVVDKENQ
ncbi:beta-lactamase family protein [Algoriphagus aestuarii]|nr:beta-lactamase family protein [Algoriphagus aestuarii]